MNSPVRIASIVFYVLAAAVALLGLFQLLIGLGVFAIINVAVGVLYGFIGYWIGGRDQRGYTWGLWTSVVSVAWSLYSAFTGDATITALLIPFYLAAAILLWINRAEFAYNGKGR